MARDMCEAVAFARCDGLPPQGNPAIGGRLFAKGVLPLAEVVRLGMRGIAGIG